MPFGLISIIKLLQQLFKYSTFNLEATTIVLNNNRVLSSTGLSLKKRLQQAFVIIAGTRHIRYFHSRKIFTSLFVVIQCVGSFVEDNLLTKLVVVGRLLLLVNSSMFSSCHLFLSPGRSSARRGCIWEFHDRWLAPAAAEQRCPPACNMITV